MRYYNINNPSIKVSFKEAVLQGISFDMGLFMPESIPVLDKSFFNKLSVMSLPQIAFEVGVNYIGDDIPMSEYERICYDAFNFPIHLKKLDDNRHVLELFHGPTAAFKDFGARFMSKCFRYFAKDNDEKTVVLVATSGDTGGAIANSFLGVDNVDVIILYPSGNVSDLQEKQLTTLGKNIIALEVDGTFDDCQRIVKEAFTKFETNGKISLTSANSINIARLIPQSFYYYYAVGQLGKVAPAISIPSGNFGNLTGALLALKSGLPVERIVASTNINKVVPEYLETGEFSPKGSLQTIANAMDVGNPSNFVRMLKIFDGNWNKVNAMVSGYWFTDEQIRNHIWEEYKQTEYILDPHGAVASLGLNEYLKKNRNSVGIIVETAHPAKFIDVVEPIVDQEIPFPESLKGFMGKEKLAIRIKPDYRELDDYLSSNY